MDIENNEALNQEMDYSESPETESPAESNEDSYELDAEDRYEDAEEVEEESPRERKAPESIPYNRFAEVNDRYRQTEAEKARLEAELNFYKQQQQSISSFKSPEQIQEEERLAQVREQAKAAGIVTRDDLEGIEKKIREEFEQKEQSREWERSIVEQTRDLEKKYSNIPGMPKKLDYQELIDFGSKRGTFTQNLDDLIWLKYKDVLAANYTSPKTKVAPVAQRASNAGAQPNFDEMTTEQMREWLISQKR